MKHDVKHDVKDDVQALVGGVVGAFSRGLLGLRGLDAFLGCERILARPSDRHAKELDAVVGWGHKPTADKARAYAKRHGLPYVALEDGFLRSVGLGPEEPPLSLVIDDLGIYYDAHGPSRLETILREESLDDDRLVARARRCRERIVQARISKYNESPVALPEAFRESKRTRDIVLVVDQTYGDASVTRGLAGPDTFRKMLDAAVREHPGARVVVKVHPATVVGKKRGYLTGELGREGVEVLAESVNPQALIEQVDHVYVCSSQVGFEALMAGKPVTCFGAPFYAGWGLTDDRVAIDRRGRARSLDQLVAAALILYPRYVHPITGRRCVVEEVIEHLALQREMFERNARTYYCVGFSTWKRPFVREFLRSPGKEVRFVGSWGDVLCADRPEDAAVVLWGSRLPRCNVSSLPVVRMEDGFLRSVRLGSELTAPGSLVLDERGIYYDPTTPSDLEEILATVSFTEEELGRAARLREQIVELGVSKYNLPTRQVMKLAPAPGQRVVFVPGQVQDDASIRLGSPAVRSDEQLLREVRRTRPDAYVVYKPHPDVLSGNRGGPVVEAASGLWDARVEDVALPTCLGWVQEVHTMTSLVGFEALLRGLPVVTYGQPFYAGWGLTEDRAPVARRLRELMLDELVAGTLLRYPRYYSWRARAYCTAEDMVGELARAKGRGGTWSFRFPWILRRARDISSLARAWIHA